MIATLVALDPQPVGRRITTWWHRTRHAGQGAAHRPGSDLSFHCPSCSRTFPGFSSWDEHVRLNHAV